MSRRTPRTPCDEETRKSRRFSTGSFQQLQSRASNSRHSENDEFVTVCYKSQVKIELLSDSLKNALNALIMPDGDVNCRCA